MILPEFIPIRIDDKWGFCNEQKEIKIKAIFDDVKFFSEGIAFVRINDKWGVIDEKGNEIIDFIYSDVGVNSINFSGFTGFDEIIDNMKFRNGLAVVSKIWYSKNYDYEMDEEYNIGHVEWGVIDNKGNTVIDFIYDELKSLLNGLLIAKKDDESSTWRNRYGIIDLDNNIVVNFTYGSIQRISQHFILAYMDDPMGTYYDLFTTEGKFIAESTDCPLGAKSEGLYRIRPYFESGLKVGYITEKGEIRIEPIFEEGLDFHDGKVAVKLFSEDGYANSEWVYLDKKGNVIIRDGFLDATSFSEGFAIVKKNISSRIQKFYIDEYGNNIFKSCFSEDYLLNPFEKGFAAIKDVRNNKIFYLDKSGKKISKKEVSKILQENYVEPKFLAEDTFENYTEPKYSEDALCSISPPVNSMYPPLLKPKFEKKYSYRENFAVVIKNGKYYFIDSSDNIVLPNHNTLDENGISFPYFQEANSFNNGFAGVKINDKWGFINIKGEMEISPKYDLVDQTFINGLNKVKNGDLVFYISYLGTEYLSINTDIETPELPY